MAAINVWQNGTALTHMHSRLGADIRYGLLLLHTYFVHAREMRTKQLAQGNKNTQLNFAWGKALARSVASLIAPHRDALLNIIKWEKLRRKIVFVRVIPFMLHAARKNYSSLTLFVFYEVWPRARSISPSDVDDGPLRVCALSQQL
jgi:hypothetical protein